MDHGTYKSWAQRVTRLPSFKQWPGSRFSFLQSMKSSVCRVRVSYVHIRTYRKKDQYQDLRSALPFRK